jgi:hypothetical protein
MADTHDTTDRFHLVVDSLKLNWLDIYSGVAGILVTDLMLQGMPPRLSGTLPKARYLHDSLGARLTQWADYLLPIRGE